MCGNSDFEDCYGLRRRLQGARPHGGCMVFKAAEKPSGPCSYEVIHGKLFSYGLRHPGRGAGLEPAAGGRDGGEEAAMVGILSEVAGVERREAPPWDAQTSVVAGRPVSFSVYHDLIQAIVSALEARDPHTAEHSLRVANMVESTCRLMGLPGYQADAIHMAAHLHDIGKIGVPDAVLLKRARLTEGEHAVLRDHARLGAEIIGACPALAEVALMVRHHHERWDGSGYPDGLVGERIPFGSRVIVVCDSIDAMLGKRASKRPLTERECVQEIFLNMGVMYDPDIAWFVLKRWDAIVRPVDFKDSGDFELVGTAACRSLRCAVPSAGLQGMRATC